MKACSVASLFTISAFVVSLFAELIAERGKIHPVAAINTVTKQQTCVFFFSIKTYSYKNYDPTLIVVTRQNGLVD